MNRREFAFAGTAGAVSLGLAGWSLQAQAQGGSAPAASEYRVLKQPAPTAAPKGKGELIEFFGYWCPHCNAFEPEFAAWLRQAPANVAPRRVPVAFRPDMVPLQRLFYALEALGQVGALHARVFAAIHQQRINLMSDQAVLQWANAQPELKGRFDAAYKSFGMDARLSQANQLAQLYGIEGVPSFGAAGRYYIDGETAKGISRALQVAVQLAQQHRA